MRRASAILAILVALTGLMGFVSSIDIEGVATSGVFGVALAVSGVAALLGRDLIYLAASWGLYLGMNLAADVDVIDTFRHESSAAARSGSIFLTALLVIGVIGLLLTLAARHRESRS
jgi:hypothetical protein